MPATNSYHTHHSPWGAYWSFVLGRYGQGGGFAIADVRNPGSSVYLGYHEADAPPRLLPFVSTKTAAVQAENFIGSEVIAKAKELGFGFFAENEIERTLTACTDRWKAGRLTFELISPILEIPDLDSRTLDEDEERFYLAPVVLAKLTIDNASNSVPVRAFFGMQGARRTFSKVPEYGLKGFACGPSWGVAVSDEVDAVVEAQDFAFLLNALGPNGPSVNPLGAEAGLVFHAAPGEVKTFELVLGAWREGNVTSALPAFPVFSSAFANLEDALLEGLENFGASTELAARTDARLSPAGLSADRRWLLAQAAHSYLASTEYLETVQGRRIFVVNEGEYQMINTLDLTIDQAFWELEFHPWTVKNELSFYRDRYSYQDAYGLSFTHDQGVADQFSPAEWSSYELPKLTGCFSFMTHEQLLNWTITTALYVGKTKDAVWLTAQSGLVQSLLTSLLSRDANGDGIMDKDSDRCQGGSEITTYDSLDESLGQARNNLYLGVKTWAGYRALAYLFHVLNDKVSEKTSKDRSLLCAQSIAAKFVAEGSGGYIPAVFEKGNTSRIIPAIEGLAYPSFWRDNEALDAGGPFQTFLARLKTHVQTVLKPGVCIDDKSHGWKLSSTSYNTWLSKIYLNQFVCESILKVKEPDAAKADAAHVKWQAEASAAWAATDQVHSQTGADLGSRLYPRLVTAILWLKPPTV